MTVLTVGHSNHDAESFLNLLESADVEVLADVRTAPYSAYSNQFNQDPLKVLLKDRGIGYVFLGRELGGRPTGDEFYDEDGFVFYDRVAETGLFRSGLDRLLTGASDRRVALMCSEGHPAECHRHLMISRVLVEQESVDVEHVLPDGSILTAAELFEEQRPPVNLFGQEEMTWKSIRSVSRNTPLSSSSTS